MLPRLGTILYATASDRSAPGVLLLAYSLFVFHHIDLHTVATWLP